MRIKTIEMTEGEPVKILLRFLLPLFLGSLFQQLYSLADSMIIGRVLGSHFLAASGSSYPVIVLIMSIANGMSLGGLVIVSKLKGAHNQADTHSAISTSVIFCTGLGILFLCIGLIFTRSIIDILHVPSNIYDEALAYLRIWILSSPFLFLYNSCASVCNAIGKPKIPIIFIGVASGLNIASDFLFILGLKMGLVGAAWGSFLSLGVASIGLLIYLIHALNKAHKQNGAVPYALFNSMLLGKMFKIGSMSAFQQSIISVGLFVLQILVNRYGTIVIAGYTAAIKIDTIARMLFVNLGVALSSFISQNIGAQLYERVKKGYRSALFLALCIGAFLAVILLLFSGPLVSLFIDSGSSPQEHLVGITYLHTICGFYVLIGYLFVTNGFFRSVNRVSFLIIASILNISAKVISAFVLSNTFAYQGIWWANPIGWTVGSLALAVFYFSGTWKKEMKL